MIYRESIKIGKEEMILETGKMAKQANGSVFAVYSGSAVLATACCGSSVIEGLDYVPLQVEYNEKYYAAGKIPGGFLKREGRPKDKEILVCRLIDRPLRPLFDKSFQREIQIVPTTLSTDQINPPDMIAMVASSAAVTISDIPFHGPVGAVRVCYVNGEYIINPTFIEIEQGSLDIIVAGTMTGITMVEGGSTEVSEEILIQAISIAEPVIKEICEAQIRLAEKVGKKKLPLNIKDDEFPLSDAIRKFAYEKLKDASFVLGKMERSAAIHSVRDETIEHFADQLDEETGEKHVKQLFEEMEKEIVRSSILHDKKRTDHRSPEQIRPISCEVDVLPRTHGSALFTRGETQSLGVTTLGTVYDEQMKDDIDGEKSFEHFMLHYNFPPFSVGETGRINTGRREIGHGHLAFRALQSVLPDKDKFPYTIRVVSEILESNGSSSMATVCSGSLSLLSAGVKLRKPVAGIAMGLITEGDTTVVLSDILGEEDHLGDMDFKVAGTEDGITAFQMDIKIEGVSSQLMAQALEQAKQGRMHILQEMSKAISSPNKDISQFAPRILKIKINEEKIGAVIGPGGKNIKGIAEKSGSEINIENDGTVTIYGKNTEKAEEARNLILSLTEEPEVGRIYNGTVKRITDFGAFVEILPGKEGLVHISKLARNRVKRVDDILSMNQHIPVKLLEIDRMGRLNLSYIDALEEKES